MNNNEIAFVLGKREILWTVVFSCAVGVPSMPTMAMAQPKFLT